MLITTLQVGVTFVITDEDTEEQSNFPTTTSLVSGRVHSIFHNSAKSEQGENNVYSWEGLEGFKNLALSVNQEIDRLAKFEL